MKKILLATLALLPLFTYAQWGLTGYPVGSATSLSTTQRNAYALDNNGDVWVGFTSAGLGQCSNGNWTFSDMSNSGIPSNHVNAIFPYFGFIWVGTNAGAAYKNGSSWTVFSHSNSGLPSDTVYAVYRAATETWFGTRQGLARFDGSTWTTYTHSNSPLLSDTVLCFCPDGSNHMLVGTAKGLNALDLTNGSWSSYNDNQNQLFTSTVTSVLYEAGHNETWISANANVYRLLGGVVYPFNAFTDDFALGLPQNVSNFVSPSPGVVKFCYNNTNTNRYGMLTMNGAQTPQCFRIGGQKTFVLYNANTGIYYLGRQLGNLNTGYFLAKFDPSQVHPFIDGDAPDYANTRSLDINQVHAAVGDRGDMHWDFSTGTRYIVPKNGGAGTVFATSLWIGGLDAGGQLHIGAMTYRQTGMDFFPGPLDTTDATTDSTTAEKYDYVWKIDKTKIQEFQYYFANGSVQNGSYIPDHDILTWPAHGTGNYSRNLAPFVDVNNNGIYDPLTGGDYPKIRGDQMLYAIFNDNLAPHGETAGTPVRVEVHLSVYAYACPPVSGNDSIVNYTTYYHYDIYNRGFSTLHNTKIGVFQDVDLGFYMDDYVGCSPSTNIAFVYNGTANDGGSATAMPGTYGAQPPMSSVLILDGPDADPNDGIDNDNDGTTDEAGEHNRLNNFIYYNNDFSVTGNPQTDDNYYNYLNSTWIDGTPMTYGSNGYGGVTPVKYMFDAVPFSASGWNETTAGNLPDDRRFVLACGPFTFQPQTSTRLDYAIIYTRDMANAWGTPAYINTMYAEAQHVESWYQSNSTPSCIQWNVGMPEPEQDLRNLVLYPNPAATQLTLSYLPHNNTARYALIDLTGRIVSSGQLDAQGATQLSVEALPDGVYFVRVNDGNNFITKKFVKQ